MESSDDSSTTSASEGSREYYPVISEFPHRLHHLWKEQCHTDVTLRVHGNEHEVIRAHRVILGLFSKYFWRKLVENPVIIADLKVPGIDMLTLKTAVKCIYSEPIEPSEDNVERLFSAGKYLGISDLKSKCIEYLIRTLNNSNWGHRLSFTNRFVDCTGLLEVVMEHFARNYKNLLSSSAFEQLHKDDLVHLLRARPSVEETAIFQGVLTWLKYKQEERAVFAAELIHLIDLVALPTEFLHEQLENNDVLNNTTCWTLFEEVSVCIKQEGKTLNPDDGTSSLLPGVICDSPLAPEDDEEKSLNPDDGTSSPILPGVICDSPLDPEDQEDKSLNPDDGTSSPILPGVICDSPLAPEDDEEKSLNPDDGISSPILPGVISDSPLAPEDQEEVQNETVQGEASPRVSSPGSTPKRKLRDSYTLKQSPALKVARLDYDEDMPTEPTVPKNKDFDLKDIKADFGITKMIVEALPGDESQDNIDSNEIDKILDQRRIISFAEPLASIRVYEKRAPARPDLAKTSEGGRILYLRQYRATTKIMETDFKTVAREFNSISNNRAPPKIIWTWIPEDRLFLLGGGKGEHSCSKEAKWTDTWSPKGPWEKVSPMLRERYDFQAVALDNYLYVLGGSKDIQGKEAINSVERLCLNEREAKWEIIRYLVRSRSKFAAVKFDSTVYACGGLGAWWEKKVSGMHAKPLNTVEFYDRDQESWVLSPSCMVKHRFGHSAIVLDSKLYLIGGSGLHWKDSSEDEETMMSAEVYDATGQTWKLIASLNRPRRDGALAIMNGKIFAIGGDQSQDGKVLSSVEAYDPRTDVWEMITDELDPMGMFASSAFIPD